MSDRKNIDYIYKQNLEESIIEYLSEEKNIELHRAMHIYYQSKLAKQIEQGAYGIENMLHYLRKAGEALGYNKKKISYCQ